jgi:hypothetical protein
MRFLCFVFLIACHTAAVSLDAPDERRDDEIYRGVADHDAHGAVVMLAHATEGGFSLCTATLVAPDVLLTAAHCVLRDPPTYVSCGGSVSDKVLQPVLADTLFVHTGPKPKFEAEPAAWGRRLFTPKLTTLCDRDVAVLVLDRALPIEPLAIASALPDGDVTAVGYGLTEKGKSGERRRRNGMRILQTGPVSDASIWLGARELETTAGPCSGDSGGPLLSEDSEVIGVVSRGGSCKRDYGNIYGNASAHRALVDEAIAWAERH